MREGIIISFSHGFEKRLCRTEVTLEPRLSSRQHNLRPGHAIVEQVHADFMTFLLQADMIRRWQSNQIDGARQESADTAAHIARGDEGNFLGVNAGFFEVTVNAVDQPTNLSISASYQGVTTSAQLTVLPVAADATNADVQALQAPFRSGIAIEDYQLDPLVRSLQMPRVNLLIADDVGLGKTIEAGLVIQEMLLRHRARSVIVVCPASLCMKWQTEMAQKFGLEFRIVDAELVRRLRRERGLAANPWRHFPRLIVSIDWLKRPRAMSLFPVDSEGWEMIFDPLAAVVFAVPVAFVA